MHAFHDSCEFCFRKAILGIAAMFLNSLDWKDKTIVTISALIVKTATLESLLFTSSWNCFSFCSRSGWSAWCSQQSWIGCHQRVHGWHTYHGMLINSLTLKRIPIENRGVSGKGIFFVRQKCFFHISQTLIDVVLQSFWPRLISFPEKTGKPAGSKFLGRITSAVRLDLFLGNKGGITPAMLVNTRSSSSVDSSTS